MCYRHRLPALVSIVPAVQNPDLSHCTPEPAPSPAPLQYHSTECAAKGNNEDQITECRDECHHQASGPATVGRSISRLPWQKSLDRLQLLIPSQDSQESWLRAHDGPSVTRRLHTFPPSVLTDALPVGGCVASSLASDVQCLEWFNVDSGSRHPLETGPAVAGLSYSSPGPVSQQTLTWNLACLRLHNYFTLRKRWCSGLRHSFSLSCLSGSAGSRHSPANTRPLSTYANAYLTVCW